MPNWTQENFLGALVSLSRLSELAQRAAVLRAEMSRSLMNQHFKYLQESNMATLGPEDYVRFRQLYEKALKNGVGVFRYKEQDALVSYAYYVLEYLHPIAEGMELLGGYRFKPKASRPPTPVIAGA